MQFRDQILRCAATGKEFVWTVAEQRERARKGLPLDPPLYSPEVRAADSRLGDTYEPAEASDDVIDADPVDRIDRSFEDTPAAPARGRSPAQTKPRGHDRGSSNAGGQGGRRGPRRERKRGSEPQTELRIRHTGTVKWFDEDRGYGFVADDDGGELFLHASCLLVEESGGLREGTPIEYEVERTDRGPQAVDVVLLA